MFKDQYVSGLSVSASWKHFSVSSPSSCSNLNWLTLHHSEPLTPLQFFWLELCFLGLMSSFFLGMVSQIMPPSKMCTSYLLEPASLTSPSLAGTLFITSTTGKPIFWYIEHQKDIFHAFFLKMLDDCQN